VRRGAGEILLTSIDADGTKNGYDIELSNEIDLKFSYHGALIGMDD